MFIKAATTPHVGWVVYVNTTKEPKGLGNLQLSDKITVLHMTGPQI